MIETDDDAPHLGIEPGRNGLSYVQIPLWGSNIGLKKLWRQNRIPVRKLCFDQQILFQLYFDLSFRDYSG